MDQLTQIVGALLILTAFAAVQFERMRPDSRIYLALNLVGSLVLAVLAWVESQWGFLLLEGSGRSSPLGAWPRRCECSLAKRTA